MLESDQSRFYSQKDIWLPYQQFYCVECGEPIEDEEEKLCEKCKEKENEKDY